MKTTAASQIPRNRLPWPRKRRLQQAARRKRNDKAIRNNAVSGIDRTDGRQYAHEVEPGQRRLLPLRLTGKAYGAPDSASKQAPRNHAVVAIRRAPRQRIGQKPARSIAGLSKGADHLGLLLLSGMTSFSF